MANDDYLASLSLGYFANKEAAAYYRVAKSVTKIMVRLIDPIYEAIYPEFVRTVTKKALGNLKTLILESTKSLGVILVPLSIAFIVFADSIVKVVFGGGYLAASSALRLVSIAVLLNQMTFWINPAFLAFGKPGLRTYVAVLSTVFYIIFLLLLVPKYSYLGAAWAFLGYALVRVFVSIFAVSRVYREQERSITQHR
jgi:O-antigen/teichoic acid export membrane protein